MDGIQDQQKTLDKFYADYDVEFSEGTHYTSKFKQVLASLETIRQSVIEKTRLRKKADFYGLFAAVSKLTEGKSAPLT